MASLLCYSNFSDHWNPPTFILLVQTITEKKKFFTTQNYFFNIFTNNRLYIVYQHRLSLDTAKTRRVWGYLYNEYKLSTYYWETIKIIQKELIILILIYYEDFVAIKACLIFFLLHLYSKLTNKFKPYLTDNLNQIDLLSTSICKLSIVLAQSIYLAQNLAIMEVVWPFYVVHLYFQFQLLFPVAGVLAFTNFYFIFEMISKLIFAYFDKLKEHIDKAKALVYYFVPNSLKKHKVCLRLFQKTSERKQIVRQRFQQVRSYLINQATINQLYFFNKIKFITNYLQNKKQLKSSSIYFKQIIILKKHNNMNYSRTLSSLYSKNSGKGNKITSSIEQQQNMKLLPTQAF